MFRVLNSFSLLLLLALHLYTYVIFLSSRRRYKFIVYFQIVSLFVYYVVFKIKRGTCMLTKDLKKNVCFLHNNMFLPLFIYHLTSPRPPHAVNETI